MGVGANPGVFVGREAELGVLRGLVAGVAGGRGGVAWVEGEPGIGKSALVAQGLAAADDLGCTVFTGEADELRGRFPLGVILDCLDVGSGLAGGERGEIAGLLRGEGLGGVVPAGDAVTAAAERVLGLVDQLCAVSPVVLVVDDLQWADGASLSVWHRLAGGVGQVPLLVVGVARPVPRSQGLLVARQAVMERGGVVLSLRPLPGDEVTALMGGLVGGRPGPRLVARAAQAGGNPLYVRELTDALLRDDRLRLDGEVTEITGEPGAGTLSLAAAIEGRLGFVSHGALEVLRAAALLGARFSVRDLMVVAVRGARELAGAVAEAVEAGVLVESGRELVFRHGLIQQALVEGMPAGLRTELHRDAARALARADAPAERVAAQLLAGGRETDRWVAGEVDDWVVDWLADNAAVLVHRAPRAAADVLARAAAGVAARDKRREVLLEHLAWVLFLLARYEQTEPVARELLAGSGDPGRRGRMAWALANSLSKTGRSAEALAIVDQALRDGAVADIWAARLRSLRALMLALAFEHGEADSAAANALANALQHGEADSAAADALANAEQVDDRFAVGYSLHVRSVVRLFGGQVTDGLDFAERALAAIGDDPETTDLRLLLLTNRMSAMWNLDIDVAAQARELLALGERVGTARLDAVRGRVAEFLFEAGQWDDALAELEALLRPGADVETSLMMSVRGLAAMITAHRDDRAGLAAHLRAADHLPGPPDRWRVFRLYLLRAKAMATERDDRPGEAADVLAAALAVDHPGNPAELDGLADLVRCALAAGDRSAAEAAAGRCEQKASQLSGISAAAAAARRCRGLVDHDPGPLREAVAYYRAVTRPLGLGQALEDLAVVRAAGGDLAAAREALGEAAVIYAGLGAEWDLLRADARLRPYGVRRRRAGTRRPATGWAALTPTETKVAYLVGEGLSNPEIGTRLFLSRYTVQVHVSRILAKLQIHSRLEVAGQIPGHGAEGEDAGPVRGVATGCVSG